MFFYSQLSWILPWWKLGFGVMMLSLSCLNINLICWVKVDSFKDIFRHCFSFKSAMKKWNNYCWHKGPFCDPNTSFIWYSYEICSKNILIKVSDDHGVVKWVINCFYCYLLLFTVCFILFCLVHYVAICECWFSHLLFQQIKHSTRNISLQTYA